MTSLSTFNFAPVMDYPEDLYVFDLSNNYDPDFIATKSWAIGKYNEKRFHMYTAEQYEGRRNVHMGIDIWAASGSPVFSFYEATIAYMHDHCQKGNYGPTLVLKYRLDNRHLFALYGHLGKSCLKEREIGENIDKGQRIAELGSKEVNGGWMPHLHFQLCWEDPGEADMPGVVADESREQALKTYPDPRIVLGDLY